MKSKFNLVKLLWWDRKIRSKTRIIGGVPPLTFKAKEGTLKNYRIYGQTVDGESVGDLVTSGEHAGEYKVPVTVEGKNLFDGELAQGYYNNDVGSSNDLISSNKRVAGTSFIPVSTGSTMALTYESTIGITKCLIYYYNNNKELIKVVGWYINGSTFTIPNNASFIRIVWGAKEDWVGRDYVTLYVANISNIMVNIGSTPLAYEPYHAPITTPIYLPEPIRKVGDEAEYIDYAEQKLHRVRKNLLLYGVKSKTINGVTFRVNNDGSVTCDGTAKNNTWFTLLKNCSIFGECILSGSPFNGSDSRYLIRAYYNNDSVVADYGAGTILNFNNPFTVEIRIASGFTCRNLTFYPMIRKANIEDDTYEPYIGNTELDVTLPALPTIAGTNTLSVGTQVQPSYIELTGKIKKKS